MSLDQPLIPARYYARLADVLPQLGLDLFDVIRSANLSLDQLVAPTATLTIGEIETLVHEVESRIERRDLALLFGRSLHLSSHSVVGYGILSSPNIGYALTLTARYFTLIHPAYRLHYDTIGEQARMIFCQQVEMSDSCRALHVESIAVAAYLELVELHGGPIPGCELQIAVSHPAHIDEYRIMGIKKVVFDPDLENDITLLLPKELMSKPPVMADPDSLQLAEKRCNEMLKDTIAGANLSRWTISMLEAANDGMPSLSELAHTANLTTRTFERHLKAEGSSYRALANDVLHSKAKRMLKDPARSVTQVAHLLGYSDSANFTRAFRKQEGVSPSQYRSEAI